MKKLLLVAFALSSACWGQGFCANRQVLTSKGGFNNLAAIVPNATITASPGPLFTDSTITVQVPGISTVTADSFGNFTLCAAPGDQIVTITGTNLQSFTFPWQFGVTPKSSVTWTGTHIFTGPVTLSGPTTFPGGILSLSTASIQATADPFNLIGLTDATGGVVNLTAGANTTTNGTGGTFNITGGAGGGGGGTTGPGGNVVLSGGPPSSFLSTYGNIIFNSGPGVAINEQGFLQTNTKFNKYVNLTLVGAGVPAEVAAVDLTAQTAAIATTTLFTIPSNTFPVNNGQYVLHWNAKVTTVAGTSSTLGPLTIVYTDQDNTVQTLTAGALIAAGTVATSSAGNTTTTVLIGIPLTLNCRTLTNITYAFAYASNAANVMNYNLHLNLTAY
jgi:hypothetical protein